MLPGRRVLARDAEPIAVLCVCELIVRRPVKFVPVIVTHVPPATGPGVYKAAYSGESFSCLCSSRHSAW